MAAQRPATPVAAVEGAELEEALGELVLGIQGLGFSLPTPRLAEHRDKNLEYSNKTPGHQHRLTRASCPNHNSVRVPVTAITRASVPKPCNAVLALQYVEFCALAPSEHVKSY